MVIHNPEVAEFLRQEDLPIYVEHRRSTFCYLTTNMADRFRMFPPCPKIENWNPAELCAFLDANRQQIMDGRILWKRLRFEF